MVNTQMIKEKMREENIKQKDIAEKLSIASPTVSQKLNNIRPMYLDEALAMMDILNISSCDFGMYFLIPEKLRSAKETTAQ